MRDPLIAERFASAGRDAFIDLVSKAIEARVDFFLISGDVYDCDWTDNSIGLFFNKQVGRLAQKDIPAYLIRGNHDAESVITRSLTLPPGVINFSTSRPETHRIEKLRVAIHGLGFAHREVTKNWAVEYPLALPGWFNIGMLHTSCEGNSSHATYAPCSIADLKSRNYDYWALGHVHEYTELSQNPWIVFPGNLQGRSIRECGEKGGVLVRVVDAQVSSVERIIVDRARFAEVRISVAASVRIEEIIERVRAEAASVVVSSTHPLAVRLFLTGVTNLHDRLLAERPYLTDEFRNVLNTLGDSSVDIWLEKLVIETVRPNRNLEASQIADLDLAEAIRSDDDDLSAKEFVQELTRIVKSRASAAFREDISEVDFEAIVEEAKALILMRASSEAA